MGCCRAFRSRRPNTLRGRTVPKREAILRYRAAKKLAGTYGRGWLEPPKFRPRARKHRWDKDYQWFVDGRIHTSFNQLVRTGRMSSRKPNLQNLPQGRYREAFRAPDGRVLVVADYAQIELLLAAVIAPEPTMLEALRAGEDLHMLTATKLVGDREVDPEELKTVYRKRAKAVNFGFVYGMQTRGFVVHAKRKFGLNLTLEEAQRYRDVFFETYPGLRDWHQRERSRAEAGEDTVRTLTGRVRKVNLRWNGWRGRYVPVFEEKVNAPVQGSGADAIKTALALLWETRTQCPGHPFPVDVVHDELVVEADADHAEEVVDWVTECMVRGLKEVAGDDVPVKLETRVVRSFGEK